MNPSCTVTKMDGSTGTDSDSQFDPNQSNFNTSPFTHQVFSDNNQVLTVDGGTIPSGGFPANLWLPGATVAGGQLVIHAAPTACGTFKVFSLKEQPLIAIPVPAAAWTGLSGLIGLSLLGAAKKARSLLA